MSQDAKRVAQQTGDHPLVENLARAGYAVSGLLHLLIGWITAQIALGGGGEADQGGALGYVRDAPGGGFVLWLAVVAFAALAVWQVTEAVVGVRGGDDRERMVGRVKAGGKAVMYGALGFTAFQFARGGSSDSGDSSADVTRSLLQAPGGTVLVVLLGVAVAGVGGYHVYKGATKKFHEDLKGNAPGDLGRGVTWAGTVGYVAKGVAFLVLGGVFVAAALQQDPESATGLDAAMQTMAEAPYGTALLLVVAVGVAAYGIYSFARARYARM